MTKRMHGEGTVEERSPGRWRFRSPDGAGGRFTSESIYASRKSALAALAAFRRHVLDGSLVPVKGMTLRDYWACHFRPRLERGVEQGAVRQGTLRFYDSHWPRLEGLAGRPLAALDVPAITRWGHALSSEVKRPRSYLAVLRAILQDAVSVDFLLESNAARDVRLKAGRAEPGEADRAPTPKEAAALLGCEAIPRPDRLIIAFALGAGLRPGEWRSLELADVHLDAAVPHVVVQYGTVDRGPTKTGRKRKVPLIPLARHALVAWLEQLPTYAPANPMGLVFPSPRGKQRDDSCFGRRRPLPGEARKSNAPRWHDFLRVAGIDRTLTPHGLRHGCATGLLTGWLGQQLDPWAVQVLVGHDRLATTERYLHHGTDDLFDAMGEQSPNGPGEKSAALGMALFRRGSEGGGEVVPRGGIEPRKTPRNASVAAPQAKNEGAGTVPGLWREVYARIHAGDWPDEAEARELAAAARVAREEADPVLRAVRRVESTPAWQAGLFDLVRLLAEAEADDERKAGGGR